MQSQMGLRKHHNEQLVEVMEFQLSYWEFMVTNVRLAISKEEDLALEPETSLDHSRAFV